MATISHDPLQVESSPIHDLISNKLLEMTSDVKADDRFIICLHKLQQFYPQFTDRYVIAYLPFSCVRSWVDVMDIL